SCACGNTAPAEATARPSAARNTACTPLQRTRRTQLPEAGPASDRRTRVPASAASPPTSPTDRPEPRPIAPSPSLIPAMPRRQHGISGTRLRQRAAKVLGLFLHVFDYKYFHNFTSPVTSTWIFTTN